MEKEDLVAIIIGIFIIVAIIFIVVGCIKNIEEFNRKWDIDFGQVIDKQYKSGYSTTYVEHDEENNKTTTKTTNYPDTYKLLLEKEVEGEVLQKWVEVDAETYHKYSVGIYYDIREE